MEKYLQLVKEKVELEKHIADFNPQNLHHIKKNLNDLEVMNLQNYIIGFIDMNLYADASKIINDAIYYIETL